MLFFIQTLSHILRAGSISHVNSWDLFGPIAGATNPTMWHFYGKLVWKIITPETLISHFSEMWNQPSFGCMKQCLQSDFEKKFRISLHNAIWIEHLKRHHFFKVGHAFILKGPTLVCNEVCNLFMDGQAKGLRVCLLSEMESDLKQLSV